MKSSQQIFYKYEKKIKRFDLGNLSYLLSNVFFCTAVKILKFHLCKIKFRLADRIKIEFVLKIIKRKIIQKYKSIFTSTKSNF
jgi:hypothetical protein